MSERKPWRPRVNNDQISNPYRNAAADSLSGSRLTFDEPAEEAVRDVALRPWSDEEAFDALAIDPRAVDRGKH